MNLRKILSALLCLTLLLGCVSLAGAETQVAAGPITVTDMMGREITLDAPATRVVALSAADCEIVCALGGADTLVGRGEYCDWPASVLDVPSVQSGYETNVEQIIALQPQVVVMSSMAQSPEQVQQLEEAGIVVAVSEATDIEGVYTSIRLIGALIGRDAEAEALIMQMQGVFSDVAAQSADTGKTVYFEVSPLQWGLWTAGKGTFMDELATMCGLTNVFGDLEGWAEVSEEAVLARNPDIIVTITMYYGEGPTPVEEIASRPGWESVTAVKEGHILNADSNEISRPGPRLMDAAETLMAFTQACYPAE